MLQRAKMFRNIFLNFITPFRIFLTSSFLIKEKFLIMYPTTPFSNMFNLLISVFSSAETSKPGITADNGVILANFS